jgi:hypothetical protein
VSGGPEGASGPASTPDPANDDDSEWMTMFSTLDDREIEGLLSGQPTANPELAPLVELVATLRRSVGEVVPTMSASLRAQLRATPVVPITAGQAGRSALYKAGAVAAAAAVIASLGVGASQNRLPSGLQDVLSSTANILGIDVPAASERGDHGSQDDDAGKSGSSQGNDDGVPGGGNDNTSGGATPADPGTPGDNAPATPATPPEQSNGTPGGAPPATPTDTGDPGTDTAGDPPPSTPVTTPEPPPPAPPPPPESAPVVEEEAQELGNGNASPNGEEHGIGATAAGDGDNPGADNGGGPPSTVNAAGNGPPADRLPAD